MASITASHVSRRLRAHGIVTLPSGTRPGVRGVRVEQRGQTEVSVTVTDGSARHAELVASAAVEVLRAEGYGVDVNSMDAAILTVKAGA